MTKLFKAVYCMIYSFQVKKNNSNISSNHLKTASEACWWDLAYLVSDTNHEIEHCKQNVEQMSVKLAKTTLYTDTKNIRFNMNGCLISLKEQ